jgi:hypothetical protein
MEYLKAEPLNHLHIKGEVWVGDPCYVMDDWDNFCEKLFAVEKENKGYSDRDGVKMVTDKGSFFVCGTNCGDGVFPVKAHGYQKGTVGVDAGLLSIIPMEMIAEDKRARAKDLGFITQVDGTVEAREGDFSIDIDNCGALEVVTSGRDDDEDTCDWCGEDVDSCRCNDDDNDDEEDDEEDE